MSDSDDDRDYTPVKHLVESALGEGLDEGCMIDSWISIASYIEADGTKRCFILCSDGIGSTTELGLINYARVGIEAMVVEQFRDD